MVVGDYKERGITLELKSPKMILSSQCLACRWYFNSFFSLFLFDPLIFIEKIFLGVFRRKKTFVISNFLFLVVGVSDILPGLRRTT